MIRKGSIIWDFTKPEFGYGLVRYLHKSRFYPYKVIAYEVEWLDEEINTMTSRGNWNRTCCKENVLLVTKDEQKQMGMLGVCEPHWRESQRFIS